jgi:signal transduction histidine kinase
MPPLRQAHESPVARDAEIERERARIARDLHDEVGACLTRISLLAELAKGNPGGAEHLAGLGEAAHEAVRALDRIVWAVNPRHDHLASFVDYTSQRAGELLEAAGIRCRLELPDAADSRPLPPDFRRQVFLMVQEAVHNAAKHSGAGEVALQISPAPDFLRIRVADNGRGFDPAVTKGDGLGNMAARASEIGGVCRISSESGRGVTVEFELPWPGLGSPRQL